MYFYDTYGCHRRLGNVQYMQLESCEYRFNLRAARKCPFLVAAESCTNVKLSCRRILKNRAQVSSQKKRRDDEEGKSFLIEKANGEVITMIAEDAPLKGMLEMRAALFLFFFLLLLFLPTRSLRSLLSLVQSLLPSKSLIYFSFWIIRFRRKGLLVFRPPSFAITRTKEPERSSQCSTNSDLGPDRSDPTSIRTCTYRVLF